MLTKLG
jgi:hypothetical protein